VARADLVYRFAFAASLNLDAASRLVRKTFEDVAVKVETLRAKGNGLNAALLAVRWNRYQKSGDGPAPQAKSQVVKVLSDLSVEERVILVAVDVLGVTPQEMQGVVGMEQEALRKSLANARRSLMASALEM